MTVSQVLRMLPFPNVCRVFLAETEEGTNILHGVISLVILWVLYGALIIYSPIFQSLNGFTHNPIGNITTYTSVKPGNLDL